MWTAGYTESHHEPNIRFLEMWEVPDIVHFVIYINNLQRTDLRFVELTGQSLTMK